MHRIGESSSGFRNEGLERCTKQDQRPINNLLDRAKLPTLYNRRPPDIAKLIFKVKRSLIPENISDLFNLNNAQYDSRNSDFELQRFETLRFGSNSIKYTGPLIWSKLPRQLKLTETRDSLKRYIRKVDYY